MDLEQFRRAYMQQQGITNTPKNAIKRTKNLGKSLIDIPGAIRNDMKEAQRNSAERREILKDIKDNGLKNFNADTFVDLVKSGPARPSHTGGAIMGTADATASMARSVNEYGQTAASIAGGKRSDMYDGQDLEKGISFAITARNLTAKHMRLPLKSFRAAINIGFMTKSTTRALKEHDRKIPKSIEKVKDKAISTPDIDRDDR